MRALEGYWRRTVNRQFQASFTRPTGAPVSVLQPAASRPLARRAAGFTLVEMIVVIAIILLILGIAVPSITTMSAQTRFDAGVQTINSTLNRAYMAATADNQMTAVRFVPSQWEFRESVDPQAPTGRQHLVMYQWVGATERETAGNQFEIDFRERFERRPGIEAVPLPSDVWAAPIEAWREAPNQTVARDTLTGTIGRFELDPTRSGTQFLSADDFLVVFDPRSGLQSTRAAYPLKAFDPNSGSEVDQDLNNSAIRFLRYGSAGVVVYRREPFVTLGANALPAERSGLLREYGRPYYAQRFGGGLVMGVQETP